MEMITCNLDILIRNSCKQTRWTVIIPRIRSALVLVVEIVQTKLPLNCGRFKLVADQSWLAWSGAKLNDDIWAA